MVPTTSEPQPTGITQFISKRPLTAIQQQQESKWREGNRAAFVILNVKGTDLLNLHEESPDLDARTKQDWEKCGLVAGPMKNVTYFYPYSDVGVNAQTKHNDRSVDENCKNERAYRYFYDVENSREKLPLLVEDIGDPNHTNPSS